jgi:hypothetical protein
LAGSTQKCPPPGPRVCRSLLARGADHPNVRADGEAAVDSKTAIRYAGGWRRNARGRFRAMKQNSHRPELVPVTAPPYPLGRVVGRISRRIRPADRALWRCGKGK